LKPGPLPRKLNEPTQCTVCKNAFPWSPIYFKKTPVGKGGHALGCQQPCKDCAKIVGRAWRNENIEHARTRSRKWQKAHRVENIDRCKQWVINNKERHAANGKAWRKAHKEQKNATDRAWQIAHRDQKNAANRKWQKANPIKNRLKVHRRRLREKECEGICTQRDVNLQYKNQNGRCWWCSQSLIGKYEIDHRIPLSKGGAHDRTNIVISCVSCNRKKGTKLPHEFSGRLL